MRENKNIIIATRITESTYNKLKVICDVNNIKESKFIAYLIDSYISFQEIIKNKKVD